MTFDQALQRIARGDIPPVLFLYGEDRFLQTELVQAVTAKLIDADNREFNLETLDAKTSRPAAWFQSAKTLSFFGGVKLVVVRDLHDITFTDTESEALLEYLKKPVEEARLLLTADGIDRKRKAHKALAELPGAVECATPKEHELTAWAARRAKSRGYDLTPDAAELLVRKVGAHSGRLASELDKTLAYCGEKKEVTEKEVAAMVGELRMENPFALTEALKSLNAAEALRLLHNQLEHDVDPILMVGSIVWQFRVLWEVKCRQEKRMPAARIAEAIGVKPFAVEKAMRHTGSFSAARLRRAYAHLGQADRELKSAGRDPRGVLEALVLKLCSS